MLPSELRLSQAESIALDRLITIVRDSPSDHEARLAAVAIFTIRRHLESPAAAEHAHPPDPQPPASLPTPPPRPKPDNTPLTPDELARLARLLPNVKPQRFLKKHAPAHWRAVLHRHASTIAPTGPPSPIPRAA